MRHPPVLNLLLSNSLRRAIWWHCGLEQNADPSRRARLDAVARKHKPKCHQGGLRPHVPCNAVQFERRFPNSSIEVEPAAERRSDSNRANSRFPRTPRYNSSTRMAQAPPGQRTTPFSRSRSTYLPTGCGVTSIHADESIKTATASLPFHLRLGQIRCFNLFVGVHPQAAERRGRDSTSRRRGG